MSVNINLPEKFAFSTDILVYINDLVGGLHVGNHTLISYLNETQMRFLTALGFPELRVGDCVTFNIDLRVQYLAEIRYRDTLRVSAHIDVTSDRAYDIIYSMQNQNNKIVLNACMGMAFVNLKTGKRTDIPPQFLHAWETFAGPA